MMKNSKHPLTFGILIAITFFNSSEAWSFSADRLNQRPISSPSLAPPSISSPSPHIAAPTIRRGDSMSQANMQATCTSNRLNASDFSRPDSYQSYLRLCNSSQGTTASASRPNAGHSATISHQNIPGRGFSPTISRTNTGATASISHPNIPGRGFSPTISRPNTGATASISHPNIPGRGFSPAISRPNTGATASISHPNIPGRGFSPTISRPNTGAQLGASQGRNIASLPNSEIVRDANGRVTLSSSAPANQVQRLGTKTLSSPPSQIDLNKKQLARSLSKGMEAVPGKIEVASLDRGKLKRKIAKKASIENEEGSLAINESGRKIANENEIAEKLIALPSSPLINGVVASNAVVHIDVAELTCSNLRTLGELQNKLNEWSIQDINYFFTNGDQSFSTCCNIIRNALAPTKPPESTAASDNDGRKADPFTEGQDTSGSEELNAPIFLLSPEIHDKVAGRRMNKLATNLSLVDDVKSYVNRIHSSIAVYNSLSVSATANVTTNDITNNFKKISLAMSILAQVYDEGEVAAKTNQIRESLKSPSQTGQKINSRRSGKRDRQIANNPSYSSAKQVMDQYIEKATSDLHFISNLFIQPPKNNTNSMTVSNGNGGQAVSSASTQLASNISMPQSASQSLNSKQQEAQKEQQQQAWNSNQEKFTILKNNCNLGQPVTQVASSGENTQNKNAKGNRRNPANR